MKIAIVGAGYIGKTTVEQVANKLGISSEEVIVVVDTLQSFSVSDEERNRIENIRQKLTEPAPINTGDYLFAEQANYITGKKLPKLRRR